MVVAQIKNRHQTVASQSFISLTSGRNFGYYCEISTADPFVRDRPIEYNLYMRQLQLISLGAVVLATNIIQILNKLALCKSRDLFVLASYYVRSNHYWGQRP